MVLTETLTSFYDEFEGDNEVRRMFLTDKINKDIFQRQFDMLNIKPRMKVMDFGCGPGITTRDLARKSNPGIVVGIDVKQSAVDTAKRISEKEGVQNTRFLKMDATNVSFPDNVFDITFARNLLMHLTHPIKVLKQMLRVTKPGGLVAVVDSDGFMFNLYPVDKDLKRHLEILQKNQLSNAHMGKELFSKFTVLGLEDITVDIANYIGRGPASPEEFLYWDLMYQQIEPIVDKVFGSKEVFLKDREVWFNFLQREDRFDYFQIFFVTGRKPR